MDEAIAELIKKMIGKDVPPNLVKGVRINWPVNGQAQIFLEFSRPVCDEEERHATELATKALEEVQRRFTGQGF
jgi:hypothetical protein